MLGVSMGKKKGQATVEFLLIIALLVPIIVASTTAINEKVFKKIGTWLQSEVVAQVRYGYSRKDLGAKFDEAKAAATNGQAPLMWGPDSNTSSKHPIGKIKAGWI